ncbi:HD domain-containing protein [Bacillaceae bacterium SIJ1]|uniref:bis(5'-nucleosyl)-tetraphosphatase (symmetrical) YqeK n=1 Tax=Litoribacterium kuwaitense TaxID=1398745 RepID=UPI0013ED6416|nr:bis(5'-nucleosyl)-tetraphosphatase (symmetrical) YqeK [Litoribacterium kuwaitense]NGP43487.1 HD domain-containing protein [Litoribacterium kuwaitense]
MYSLKKAEDYVTPKLTEARKNHTLGVVEAAVELAKRYGADEDKAALAAMLHDVAKCLPPEEQKEYLQAKGIGHDLLQFHHNTWHAVVGAHMVFVELGIDDEDIIHAIRYHTTGRAGMSLLEKIIFIADYIEPNRRFEGVDGVRDLAEQSLDAAIIQALSNTIGYLVNANQTVAPDSFLAYNDTILQRKWRVEVTSKRQS